MARRANGVPEDAMDRRAKNGWINAVLGFRQFSLRGLARRMRGEVRLIWRSIASNGNDGIGLMSTHPLIA